MQDELLAALQGRMGTIDHSMPYRCSDEMDKDEWTALGKCLASVWCTLGDELIYPIGDAHPALVAPLDLPEDAKKVRGIGLCTGGSRSSVSDEVYAFTHPAAKPGRSPAAVP